jgi:dTDP-glucose 4,6-dehydratase
MNIGNPDEVTMKDLANEIIELTKSSSKIVFKDLPQDDPKVRQPDITKARSILGWEPQVMRKEGLIKTLTYLRHKFKK